jgi:hypothetical protein
MKIEDIESLQEPLDENFRKKPGDPKFDPVKESEAAADTEVKEIETRDADLVLTITPSVSEKTSTGQVAKKLAEMLYNGVSREVALKTLGVEDHEIDARQLAIEANSFIVQNYTFPDEARRMVVKATLNKLLTDAIMTGDIDTVLKATKQIASDPDVGLTAPPQNVVNISLEKVNEALNKANDRDEFKFDD